LDKRPTLGSELAQHKSAKAYNRGVAPDFREVTMRLDSEIERDVKNELQWRPGLDMADVAVSVKDGVVTLAGFVRHYRDKYEAEQAAKSVAGVVGLANDIEVRLPTVDEKPDPELAHEVVAAVRRRLPDLSENIKVVVRNGWVTLEGETEWQHQRLAAEQAVRSLVNVRGITNLIRMNPRTAPDAIERTIQKALKRNAMVNRNGISVEANGGEVVLSGTAGSWPKREEAERVAWSAPGVSEVNNHIVVNADCDDNDLGKLWIGNRDCNPQTLQ
jgi:osmotically-inducible protein OsmY